MKAKDLRLGNNFSLCLDIIYICMHKDVDNYSIKFFGLEKVDMK